MVLKKYNVKTNVIAAGVQVMRLAGNGGISLKQVKIGKLKNIPSTQ